MIVSSTYPWGTTGAQASELDRISAATKYVLSYTVHVSGPAPFSISLSALRETPVPALVPAPTPHC